MRRLLGWAEREQAGKAVEVGPQRLQHRRRVQRRGRVIQRVQPHRPRPDDPHLLAPVQARDPHRVLPEQLGREIAQRADHDRLDQIHLPAQVVLAGRDLVRVGVAVVGRPAFQGVRDEHVAARQPDLAEQLVEQLPGLPDEREPHAVLVGPGRLADEHQVGIGVAGAEHDRGPGAVEGAADAAPGLLVDDLQGLSALCGSPHPGDVKPRRRQLGSGFPQAAETWACRDIGDMGRFLDTPTWGE